MFTLNIPPVWARWLSIILHVMTRLSQMAWGRRVELFPFWCALFCMALSWQSKPIAPLIWLILGGILSLVNFFILGPHGFIKPLALSPILPGLRIQSAPHEYLSAHYRNHPSWMARFVDGTGFVFGSFLIIVNQMGGSDEWFIRHAADAFSVQTRLALVYCDSIIMFLPIYFMVQILVCNGIAAVRWSRYRRHVHARQNRPGSKLVRTVSPQLVLPPVPAVPLPNGCSPSTLVFLRNLFIHARHNPILSLLFIVAALTGLFVFWGFQNIKDAILFGCIIFPIFLWACSNITFYVSQSIGLFAPQGVARTLAQTVAPLLGWVLSLSFWILFANDSDWLNAFDGMDTFGALQIARDSWGHFFSEARVDQWQPPPMADLMEVVKTSKQVSPVAAWRFWLFLGIPALSTLCAIFASFMGALLVNPIHTTRNFFSFLRHKKDQTVTGWLAFISAAGTATTSALIAAKSFADNLLDGKAIASAERNELDLFLKPSTPESVPVRDTGSPLDDFDFESPPVPRKKQNRL